MAMTSMDLSDFEQRLVQVDWRKLRHAYGSARDLPPQLMAVARGEDDGADFFSNIYHQGTVYSATAVAVPFLAEIAHAQADPGILVTLLRLVARGVGYYQVHGQFDWNSDRATPSVLAREKKEVTRAHLAVCAAWPGLLGLAQASHDMRIEITALAGELYGIGLPAWDWLQTLLATESDALCRCAGWEALDNLLRASEGMSAYADRLHWPAPLPAEAFDTLRRDLMAQLRAVATRASASAAERWCAVDLLLQAGERAPLDVPQLAALQGPAMAMLGPSWEDRPWLQADPVLRLQVLTARLQEALPEPEVAEAAEALMAVATQNRAVRAPAVAGLVGLLTHPSPDIRLLVARQLHACGRVCQPHLESLWQAGRDDAALRTWLLAPLRICGEVTRTAPWLLDELDASEAVWAQSRDANPWDTPEGEHRLLRAVKRVQLSDADEAGARLRRGLGRWLDHHAPLTETYQNVNLPVSTLLVLDRVQALPWSLLARSLRQGLPAALVAMARRAEAGAAGEREEALAWVRAHANDSRMHESLRQSALLTAGDEAVRAAALSTLMAGTVHNTTWDVAQWWATRHPQQVPPALVDRWRGFLESQGRSAVCAAHCVWLCTGRGRVEADVLQALLGPAPEVWPLPRLAILREVAPAFSEGQRAEAVRVLAGWLAQPLAHDRHDVQEDAQWLDELGVLLLALGAVGESR